MADVALERGREFPIRRATMALWPILLMFGLAVVAASGNAGLVPVGLLVAMSVLMVRHHAVHGARVQRLVVGADDVLRLEGGAVAVSAMPLARATALRFGWTVAEAARDGASPHFDPRAHRAVAIWYGATVTTFAAHEFATPGDFLAFTELVIERITAVAPHAREEGSARAAARYALPATPQAALPAARVVSGGRASPHADGDADDPVSPGPVR